MLLSGGLPSPDLSYLRNFKYKSIQGTAAAGIGDRAIQGEFSQCSKSLNSDDIMSMRRDMRTPFMNSFIGWKEDDAFACRSTLIPFYYVP